MSAVRAAVIAGGLFDPLPLALRTISRPLPVLFTPLLVVRQRGAYGP